jgi:serine protease Do
MANNQLPRTPRKKGMKNSTAVLLCTVIGLGSIGLSGVSAYAGYSAAKSNNTSSSTTVVEKVTASNTGSTSVTVSDVSGVVAQLRPTVVEITTQTVSSSGYFGQETVATGAGSGVIISEDGYIVTNNHVIEDAQSITVKTVDGTEYEAELVGTDSQTDIAVIKVNAENLTPATIGDSDAIQVGEPVIAIGNPLGSLGGTVTTGIISAVGREITINGENMTLLQTDAAINQGNSGGGLFDANGYLIGIVNAKTMDTGIEGLGFAIPISDVTSVIEDLVAHGKVTTRPVLNVSLQDISDSSYFGRGYNLTAGVYIVQVVEGGTASDAGLEIGDRIVSFDGQDVSSSSEVKQILREHSIGDQVEMVYERDGQQYTVTLTLKGSE